MNFIQLVNASERKQAAELTQVEHSQNDHPHEESKQEILTLKPAEVAEEPELIITANEPAFEYHENE